MSDTENTRPIDVVDAKNARTGLNVTITGARDDVERMIELITGSDDVTGHAEPQIRNHPEAPAEADIVVAVLLCAPFDLGGEDEDDEG